MTAPIEIVYDFVVEPLKLEARLWNELPFLRHPDRPRNECWMNDFDAPYTYGSKLPRTYEPVPWHPEIDAIRHRINARFATAMDSCFVNGYMDGHDSLGWHSDNSPEMDDARPIFVVSLGAEREIWFRPIGAKGEVREAVKLPSGSLLRMAPGMQDSHEHRIPKASFHDCPPRISLTYRGILV